MKDYYAKKRRIKAIATWYVNHVFVCPTGKIREIFVIHNFHISRRKN